MWDVGFSKLYEGLSIVLCSFNRRSRLKRGWMLMSETGEAEVFSSNYCDNTEYCSQGVEGGGRGGEEL